MTWLFERSLPLEPMLDSHVNFLFHIYLKFEIRFDF
jgi:hypothetical protein